jgi:hypothetical protein
MRNKRNRSEGSSKTHHPLSNEMQVRINCAGASAAQILDRLQQGLDQARTENRSPLIILEDLVLLNDSVSSLLKGICRAIAGYPRTVTFWESSGLNEAFLSAIEIPG